jgi:protein-disulfide isomerase
VVKGQRARSTKPFYIALAVVAVIGAVLIVRAAGRGSGGPRAVDVQDIPAQAEGYLLGNPNAPVQILEFADYECPHCGEFAAITEPDVRKRIVEAGLASYRFFDFPLPGFRNSLPASNAAACADDQGKFWQMHDRLFHSQPEWSSQVTDNPRKIFLGYAKDLGLNADEWAKCYDEQRHLPRILANREEGRRRHVESTPTFVIGTKMIAGALPYDQFKAYVDSAAAQFAQRATTRADSQAGQGTKP